MGFAHHRLAFGPAGLAVGRDHALVDAPGRLDLDVHVGEELPQPGGLFVGEQVRAGVQGPACGVERVVLAAPVPAGGLLHPTPAQVQGVPGQADDMEGVLNPVKPSIATTSTASRHACGRAASQVLNACLEQPSTMSSSFAGPVPARTGVRSMITVTYLSPLRACRHTCSSTPTTVTPSNRSFFSMSTRWPSASTAAFAVSHATPSPSATRATVRWATTMPSNAHRNLRRESFVDPGRRPDRRAPHDRDRVVAPSLRGRARRDGRTWSGQGSRR